MSVRDAYYRRQQVTVTVTVPPVVAGTDKFIPLSKTWANEAPINIRDAYHNQQQLPVGDDPSRHAIGMVAGRPILPKNYQNVDADQALFLFYDETGSAYKLHKRPSFNRVRQQGRNMLGTNG
jgi:hypothetical protein